MRKFRKYAVRALVAGLLAFFIVPFLIPEPNSGTLTNVEAAGPNAEFVTLNNLSVHVETQKYSGPANPTAPLIVLMHGFGASTFSWRKVIEPLGKHGLVVAYDRPGFGFTERPTEWKGTNPYSFAGNFELLDALITKYGKGRPLVLVGHSAGGQLAAEYARLNPSKVDDLILVDAAILTTGGGPEGFDWFYQLPNVQRLGPVLVSSIASSGDDLLRKSHYDPKSVTQDVYDGYHQPLKVKGWERAFWNFATASKQNDLVDNLGNIWTSTLLITGEADTVVPVSDQAKLQKLIPRSTLEMIEKAGHLPQEEQPEAFVNLITGFLYREMA
jgi:pimeloyl-ACP methyl ester carboxylesterase